MGGHVICVRIAVPEIKCVCASHMDMMVWCYIILLMCSSAMESTDFHVPRVHQRPQLSCLECGVQVRNLRREEFIDL